MKVASGERPAMDNLPSVELIEQSHRFPGTYTFKAIGKPADGFVARIVAAVRDQLDVEVDPPYQVRETPAGRHVSITLEPQVQNAWEVVAVYQRLGQVTGIVFVF